MRQEACSFRVTSIPLHYSLVGSALRVILLLKRPGPAARLGRRCAPISGSSLIGPPYSGPLSNMHFRSPRCRGRFGPPTCGCDSNSPLMPGSHCGLCTIRRAGLGADSESEWPMSTKRHRPARGKGAVVIFQLVDSTTLAITASTSQEIHFLKEQHFVDFILQIFKWSWRIKKGTDRIRRRRRGRAPANFEFPVGLG